MNCFSGDLQVDVVGQRASERGQMAKITYLAETVANACSLLSAEKTVCTVKASNFGPHGNFGPYVQKGFLSSKRFLRKIQGNESCRKTSDFQTLFCSFFVCTEYIQISYIQLSPIIGQVSYYWTTHIVRNLTNSKVAETKALEPLKS